MFKYEIEQIVYYFRDNRVHSAPVLSRMYVENSPMEHCAANKEQRELYAVFGPSRIMYSTVHGTFDEDELFGSRSELADFLLDGVE